MSTDFPAPASASGTPPPSDPSTADEVPGITLRQELGHGGFGTVYLGRDTVIGRDVAVKIDRRALVSASDKRRFAREVTAAGQVSAHPNIVTLLSGGITQRNRPYLVMELCPGGSLNSRLAESGPQPPEDVVRVGIAIADALAAAHAVGILHRDVKPANILITAYGAPALADFGLASLPAEWDMATMSQLALTPSFAAPESFMSNAASPLADVFSLGATLYALLSGRPPRWTPTGSPSIVEMLELSREPLPPLDVPVPGLMDAIAHATAPDPERRTPSAAAMRDELLAIAATIPGDDVRRYAPAVGSASPGPGAPPREGAPSQTADPQATDPQATVAAAAIGPAAQDPTTTPTTGPGAPAVGDHGTRFVTGPTPPPGGPSPWSFPSDPAPPAPTSAPPPTIALPPRSAGTPPLDPTRVLGPPAPSSGPAPTIGPTPAPGPAPTPGPTSAPAYLPPDPLAPPVGPPSRIAPPPPPSRRTGRTLATVVAAVLVLSLGGWGVATLLGGPQARQDPPVAHTPTGPASPDPSGTAATPDTTPSSGPTTVASPEEPFRIGSCWGGLLYLTGAAPTAQELPCTGPHTYEAFASGTLHTGTDHTRYQTLEADSVVVDTCTPEALTAYLGAPPPEGTLIKVLGPQEPLSEWDGNKFLCLADVGLSTPPR